MNTSDICRAMDKIAPLSTAEDWDNVGLLVGREGKAVTTVLLCIDLTQSVLNEAIDNDVDMIIAYHPTIFKPLTRITADSSPIVYEAITHDIAIYSPHTALDVAQGGTNDVLAELIGLSDLRSLKDASLNNIKSYKIVTFVTSDNTQEITEAATQAGAGIIGNYSKCTFMSPGVGTYQGNDASCPTIGNKNELSSVEETRIEMICPEKVVFQVASAIKEAHSYEEPPVDIYPLLQTSDSNGMGRAGRLQRPLPQKKLIADIKKKLNLKKINAAFAGDDERMIGTVAVAAGSCGAMWKSALEAGAGLYVTGELRHHDALAAVNSGMTVLCTGHSNSERPTLPILASRLKELAPGLETIISEIDRDPFSII